MIILLLCLIQEIQDDKEVNVEIDSGTLHRLEKQELERISFTFAVYNYSGFEEAPPATQTKKKTKKRTIRLSFKPDETISSTLPSGQSSLAPSPRTTPAVSTESQTYYPSSSLLSDDASRHWLPTSMSAATVPSCASSTLPSRTFPVAAVASHTPTIVAPSCTSTTSVPSLTSTAVPSRTPTTTVSSRTPIGHTSTTTIPTRAPTTAVPTRAPTTAVPSRAPTTAVPSRASTTAVPSRAPTTTVPSRAHTTAVPSRAPTTAVPSRAPTTAVPSRAPTTAVPSRAPTTAVPSRAPTTAVPSRAPTTAVPSRAPTTAVPSRAPTTAVPSRTSTASASHTHVNRGGKSQELSDIFKENFPVSGI